MRSSSTVLEPGARVDKYQLVRKLGQGGFGVVFVALDTQLDRQVALKLLLPEHTSNPVVLQRFLQEARSAAKVMHPGIVTVFECGQFEGTAYITMELLQGETLASRLRHTRLDFAKIYELARQIASALHAAHAAGIVHRDLKPDNLFLVRDPAAVGGERVKILDFGIAKLAEPTRSGPETGSLMVFGTPMYMSPEQCKSSARVDHRADIYSLGCILYELVTGTTPFTGQFGELIGKHLFLEPRPVRELNPNVPRTLEVLIMQMLAKEPGDRPTSLGTLFEGTPSSEPAGPPAFVSGTTPTVVTGFGGATTLASVGSIPTAPDARSRSGRWLALVGGGLAVGGLVFALAIARDDDGRAAAPLPSPTVQLQASPPPDAAPAPVPEPAAAEPTPAPATPVIVENARPRPPRTTRPRPPRTTTTTTKTTTTTPVIPTPDPTPTPPKCAKPPCKTLSGDI